MSKILIILLLFSFPVYADFYIDVGLEIYNEKKDSFWQRDGIPIENPIGTIEVGYELEKVSLFFRHASSIQQKDTGFNAVGIKIRLTD